MMLQPLSINGQAETLAEQLAKRATQALIDEVRLSPKPGLVDSRGNGAHHDLCLDLMLRSAHSLTPTFYALALAGWCRAADVALRQEIGRLGRAGEQQMMQVTGGVNTHRGAIWAMGLLVTSVAMCPQQISVTQIVERAASLAQLPDARCPKRFSKGAHAVKRYQVPGAREEAQLGFPHIIELALPQLTYSRMSGASEAQARLNALLAIMSRLADTCVLSRGGMSALQTMHRGAALVLQAGGVHSELGAKQLWQLEQRMLADNVSPGGAADLLAASLFLDGIATSQWAMTH
jgi:triphosphoribosyl-dephospho-CoA synthase